MNNLPALGEIKQYLGLDGEEYDKLLSVFRDTAVALVEKCLRYKLSDTIPAEVKDAVLFIIWQLYFHRDNDEFHLCNIEKTVAAMLSDIRMQKF
jgi:hypothetical protein